MMPFVKVGLQKMPLDSPTPQDIANYVQIKYNNSIARLIRDAERPIFTYPTWPP